MKRKNEDLIKEKRRGRKRSNFCVRLRRENISSDSATLSKVFFLLIHLASFFSLESSIRKGLSL